MVVFTNIFIVQVNVTIGWYELIMAAHMRTLVIHMVTLVVS